jgi:predicted nuclease of restriction endonuclease-like (RecB) superfamily
MKSTSRQFAQVLSIIRAHRAGALASVNVEHLLSRWEIGGYLSGKIKHDGWGQSTIDNLVDYIHANAPEERGYGRSNLYNMVSVYEAFTSPDFAALLAKYGEPIIQMSSGQIPPAAIVQPATGQIVQSAVTQMVTRTIVQTASAQFVSMPPVLALTTFSNLLEIVNRTRSAQERLFYVVYAFRERLNTVELRKRLVDDAFSSVLGGNKRNYSKALTAAHPDATAIIPDTALVDFLHLPPKHSEVRLRKGIVANMREFILSIGRDFLFVGEEFPVKVGGSDFRVDLLFYHRALRCLVAFELKAREFRPADMGQLEFYLEALDRDVKRADENPTIGVLLCKSADHATVEYALSRTMSPALVAEYKRVMIPREVLQETFDRYLGLESQ